MNRVSFLLCVATFSLLQPCWAQVERNRGHANATHRITEPKVSLTVIPESPKPGAQYQIMCTVSAFPIENVASVFLLFNGTLLGGFYNNLGRNFEFTSNSTAEEAAHLSIGRGTTPETNSTFGFVLQPRNPAAGFGSYICELWQSNGLAKKSTPWVHHKPAAVKPTVTLIPPHHNPQPGARFSIYCAVNAFPIENVTMVSLLLDNDCLGWWYHYYPGENLFYFYKDEFSDNAAQLSLSNGTVSQPTSTKSTLEFVLQPKKLTAGYGRYICEVQYRRTGHNIATTRSSSWYHDYKQDQPTVNLTASTKLGKQFTVNCTVSEIEVVDDVSLLLNKTYLAEWHHGQHYFEFLPNQTSVNAANISIKNGSVTIHPSTVTLGFVLVPQNENAGFGNYTCEVNYYQNGQQSKRSNLWVHRKPAVELRPSPKTTPLPGADFTIDCNVIGMEMENVTNVRLYRNNAKLGEWHHYPDNIFQFIASQTNAANLSITSWQTSSSAFHFILHPQGDAEGSYGRYFCEVVYWNRPYVIHKSSAFEYKKPKVTLKPSSSAASGGNWTINCTVSEVTLGNVKKMSLLFNKTSLGWWQSNGNNTFTFTSDQTAEDAAHLAISQGVELDRAGTFGFVLHPNTPTAGFDSYICEVQFVNNHYSVQSTPWKREHRPVTPPPRTTTKRPTPKPKSHRIDPWIISTAVLGVLLGIGLVAYLINRFKNGCNYSL